MRHAMLLLQMEKYKLENILKKGRLIMGKAVPPCEEDLRKYHETMEALSILKHFGGR